MPWVEEEQIEKAREIDLLSYLQTYEPRELKPDGPGRYVTESHGSLVISNGKWKWNNGSVGGVSALDYLTKVRGVGFVEAVELLTGERAADARAYQEAAKAQPPPKKWPFHPPRPLRYSNGAVSYLQKRGISPEVINRCINWRRFSAHGALSRIKCLCLYGQPIGEYYDCFPVQLIHIAV